MRQASSRTRILSEYQHRARDGSGQDPRRPRGAQEARRCVSKTLHKKLPKRCADASIAEDTFVAFIGTDHCDDDFNHTPNNDSASMFDPLHAQVRGGTESYCPSSPGPINSAGHACAELCNVAMRCCRSWISDGSEDKAFRQAVTDIVSVLYVRRIVQKANLAMLNDAQRFHATIRRFLEGGAQCLE